jgi:hypothetical protein
MPPPLFGRFVLSVAVTWTLCMVKPGSVDVRLQLFNVSCDDPEPTVDVDVSAVTGRVFPGTLFIALATLVWICDAVSPAATGTVTLTGDPWDGVIVTVTLPAPVAVPLDIDV